MGRWADQERWCDGSSWAGGSIREALARSLGGLELMLV
jgi:hypothetical protein